MAALKFENAVTQPPQQFAYLITDLARSNIVESTTQRSNESAQPFLRTSQSKILGACYRDYSQI